MVNNDDGKDFDPEVARMFQRLRQMEPPEVGPVRQSSSLRFLVLAAAAGIAILALFAASTMLGVWSDVEVGTATETSLPTQTPTLAPTIEPQVTPEVADTARPVIPGAHSAPAIEGGGRTPPMSEPTVLVLNGTNETGLAQTVADALTGIGYPTLINNTDSFGEPSYVAAHERALGTAKGLAEDLGIDVVERPFEPLVSHSHEELRMFGRFPEVDIVVVLGTDFDTAGVVLRSWAEVEAVTPNYVVVGPDDSQLFMPSAMRIAQTLRVPDALGGPIAVKGDEWVRFDATALARIVQKSMDQYDPAGDYRLAAAVATGYWYANEVTEHLTMSYLDPDDGVLVIQVAPFAASAWVGWDIEPGQPDVSGGVATELDPDGLFAQVAVFDAERNVQVVIRYVNSGAIAGSGSSALSAGDGRSLAASVLRYLEPLVGQTFEEPGQ